MISKDKLLICSSGHEAEKYNFPSYENFTDTPQVNGINGEDFDGEEKDPAFISQDVSGSFELHQYDNEEELTRQREVRMKNLTKCNLSLVPHAENCV